MTRACQPDHDGYVDRDGVKVFYEVFGAGNSPTLLLAHGWQICHSRLWKHQVAELSRHYQVVTYDWPGNGRSDRPVDPAAYDLLAMAGHPTAILDAIGVPEAIFVGHSGGTLVSIATAAAYPDRVRAMVLVGGPYLGTGGPPMPVMFDSVRRFREHRIDDAGGWEQINYHAMLADYPAVARWFIGALVPEPHSTKAIEDGVSYALDSDAETMVRTLDFADVEGLFANLAVIYDIVVTMVHCPVLVVHGTDDPCVIGHGEALAEAFGGDLLICEGSGHNPHARDPIRFNLGVREFVDRVCPPPPKTRRWTRALARRRQALMVCSPIGLGHARRDIAVARELRALRPDLEIQWLAQHPVTQLLASAGEVVHPASSALASESAHFEAESGEHDLHAFQAIRNMDEILVRNFHIFHDLVTDEPFDVVIADEAWDLDYFLHENPELKRSPLVWMTDFVGWVPMPDGGDHEQFLTTDYNAEMVEHIARFPRLRDRSVFVGDPDDVVPLPLGDTLPGIREWTEQHFAFPGYITGYDPLPTRDELRAEFGWAPDERVCVVTVGGSGVGRHLLAKVIAAYPAAARAIGGLRMIVVAGPRIDPTSFAVPAGVEIHGFVPELHRHLSACDLAVVQGGLTTTMELTAARRPFLSFPLAHHFEQQVHVRHRLERHRAGQSLDYATANSDSIAAAMAIEITRDTAEYLSVPTDGARRAASIINEVL